MLLTVGMIVRDEEKYLEGCLTALSPLLQMANVELLIADTGSRDATPEIARHFTEQVFSIPWENNFSAARNAVLERASGKWFFYLDADEWLEGADIVAEFFCSGEFRNYESASLTVKSYMDEARKQESVGRALRLFHIREGMRFVHPIHESVEFHPPVKRLDAVLLHFGYNRDDAELMERKKKRNEPLLLAEYLRNPDGLRALCNLAKDYIHVGEYDKATPLLERGIELEQKAPEAGYRCYLYNNLAKLQLIRGDGSAMERTATAYFSGKDRPYGTDIDILSYLANWLGSEKRWKEAAEAYSSALRLYEDYCAGKMDEPDVYGDSLFFVRPERQEQNRLDYARCRIQLGEPGAAMDILAKCGPSKERDTLWRIARDALEMPGGILTIDTANAPAPAPGDDLYLSRQNAGQVMFPEQSVLVSVAVMGYNGLEKTRRCVECVLKYTQDVNYELILIDNGSSDGTLDFFRSVAHPRKKIIRVTKNIGAAFGANTAFRVFSGRYLAVVSGDICVTPRWLSNLLFCMESDRRIGLALPLSTNTSNQQQPQIQFDSFEEMEAAAERYNHIDPSKWQERMRLVTTVMLYRRDLIELIGKQDSGFFHDFLEDDYTARIRRAGYRLILCGDTFIHHDHDLRAKNPEALQESLEAGRKNYRDKYHGLDPWNDFNNFEYFLLNQMEPCSVKALPVILGVDVRCGTPILELRNRLRAAGISQTRSQAFTTQAKYYEDLLSVCGRVVQGPIETLGDHFSRESFDYILLGEPVNAYPYPVRLLERLLSLLKPGGQLLFKLHNCFDLRVLLSTLGQEGLLDGELPVQMSLKDLYTVLNLFKVSHIHIAGEGHDSDPALIDSLQELVTLACREDGETVLKNLRIKNYLFRITK